MSKIKVDTIRNYDSAVDFSQGFNVGGASIIQNYTESADMPETPTPVNGDYWWDTANEVLYRYMDGGFRALGAASPVVFTWGGDRGTFAGGYSSSFQNVIDYVNITSAGNASDFGDLTVARNGPAATASTTRNVFLSGWTGSVYSNVMDYITTASTGNATDFGDYTVPLSSPASGAAAYAHAQGVTSNGTTGLFQGGYNGSARIVDIHKITIATPGNSTDFGDLTVARMQAGAAGDATRGLCSSGSGSGNSNVIDYVTIATPGNATDFGDGTLVRTELMGASDSTRSLFAGGHGDGSAPERVTIDYVTTQTTGNATDFGDLTGQRFDGGANSNGTKALFTGYHDNATSNIIDQVTIQTAANATDFGDLTVARFGLSAASGTAS